MPRKIFSRSASREPRSPDLLEHVSSSPPERNSPFCPTDQAPLSNDDDPPKPPSPKRPFLAVGSKSDSHLSGKKSAKNRVYNMMSRNKSGTQVLALDTPSSHEKELHISPPSSPSADLSTNGSCEPEYKSKSKSKLLHALRKEKQTVPAYKIEALEGESIAPRLNIGTASIEGEFYKIEYGQFKGRPACMIIVDMKQVYIPDNTIDKAEVQFQFAQDAAQIDPSKNLEPTQNAETLISKILAPDYIEGRSATTQQTKHHSVKPNIEGYGFKIGGGATGGRITQTNEHRWRVLGRREPHNDIYDTFGWTIVQNEISKDSVPRKVRLGMIAFHEHQPFCVNVSIKGSTRQKHRSPKATHEARWFYPPSSEDVGHHILQEAMVENLVSKQNLLIGDIAASMGKTVNLIDMLDIGGDIGGAIDGGGIVTDLSSIGDDGLAVDDSAVMNF